MTAVLVPTKVQLQLVRPQPGGALAARGDISARSRFWLLFVLIVLVPTGAALAYYGFIASSIYVSEARYVVRAPDNGRSSGGVISQGNASRTADVHAINAFLTSRDAMQMLRRDGTLERAYGDEAIDALSRFPRPWETGTAEALFSYYRSMTGVKYNGTTGISTLSVSAYDAATAQAIATTLMESGEAMANRLTARMREDFVATAVQEAVEARERVMQALVRITEWRDREQQIDPASYSTGIIEVITRLSLEAAQLRAQLSDMEVSSPQNPGLPSLRARIASLNAQIDGERRLLAGSSSSLASKIAEYEQLVLERQFAEKLFESAIAAQESARADAQKQQIYVERVVEPASPDQAEAMRRVLPIVLTFFVSFLCFLFISAIATNFARHGAFARYFSNPGAA